jgi:hypothetical protein
MEQETRQEAFLNFGPRWKNLRRINYGDGEALAQLELLPDFAADLPQFALHPALMDLATSAGLPLVEGYAETTTFTCRFLTARCVSTMRCRRGSSAMSRTSGTGMTIGRCRHLIFGFWMKTAVS